MFYKIHLTLFLSLLGRALLCINGSIFTSQCAYNRESKYIVLYCLCTDSTHGVIGDMVISLLKHYTPVHGSVNRIADSSQCVRYFQSCIDTHWIIHTFVHT
jgi:hypothetical protein